MTIVNQQLLFIVAISFNHILMLTYLILLLLISRH